MDNYYRNPANIEPVRIFAQNRAEATSIRSVAAEIGLNQSTLHNFVHGAMPHPRIRRALHEWYERELDEATVRAQQGIVALLSGLPNDQHPEARAKLLRHVASVYREAGIEPPPWVWDQ